MPGTCPDLAHPFDRARLAARWRTGLRLLAPALLALGSGEARAAWPTTPGANVVVCNQVGAQLFRGAITDGDGGLFVAWTDLRTGQGDIYAQHITVNGSLAWNPTGKLVCGAAGGQDDPVLVSDGAGGVIVAWRDLRSGVTGDIYAQRVDAAGLVCWTLNGIPLCTASGEQALPVIVSDGRPLVPGPVSASNPTGAIIAWEDWRSEIAIRAQRVDAAGNSRWAANGARLSTSPLPQFEPALVEDGQGGAFCVWAEQGPSGYDIGGQHVESGGTLVWSGTAGVSVNATAGDQLHAQVLRDSLDGALVVWEDHRGADADVYAQRLSYFGTRRWGGNGIAVSRAPGDQRRPAVASDRAGGLIAVWSDQRSDADIYVQRLNGAGLAQWNADGVPVCDATNVQQFPAIAADGQGGALIAWEDYRLNGVGDIYSQRVTGAGTKAWAGNGTLVCNANSNQYGVGIVSSGDTLGIALWTDMRSGGSDIYAQRIPFTITLDAPSGAAGLALAAGPSPARGQVSFAWTLSGAAHVDLAIFDAAGRRVRSLVDGERPAGPGVLAWDARDREGRACADGVYFARLSVAGASPVVRRIVLRR